MLVGYFTIDIPLDKAIASKKVLFDKKIINIDFANDSNDINYFDEYYLYVMAAFAANEKKAYKVFDEENRLLFIDKTKDGHYMVSLEVYDTDDKKRGFLDDFFGGSRKVEIEENSDELFKIYDPSQNRWVKPLIGFIVFLSLSTGAYFIIQKSQESKKPAPIHTEQNITAVPLSQEEIWRLKRLSSLDLIAEIKHEVNTLQQDPLLEKRGRISLVSMSHMVTGDQLNSSGKIGFEFDFPVSESLSVADNLYSKDVPFSFKKTRVILKEKTLKGTSFECIRQAVTIDTGSDGAAVVKERRGGQIKLHYSDLRPGYFLNNIKYIIEACPMYIESVSLVDGKFEVDSVIYPEEGI